MTVTRQVRPTTEPPHFATLLVMALAPEEIGRRIAKRRKELGWTHERLAHEMQVGLRTVQRWQKGIDPKNGKSWLPRLATLMRLADVMGVEQSYFVEEEEEREADQEIADRLESLEEKVADGFEAIEEAIAQLAERLPRQDAR